MSKNTFLVTSAINTKFGVFNSQDRLTQTLATVNRIKEKAPGSKIIFLEMAALPLTAEQSQKITESVDYLIDFTTDGAVQSLYHSTDNWDVVKNVTEVMCFGKALKMLHHDTDQLADSQRIFKISGRYLLSDDFDIDYYNQYNVQTNIIVSKSRSSQFDISLTQVPRQFMSRLWSWPTSLTNEIIQVYDQGLRFMQSRILQGGYVDIEHLLYKFLDHNKVIERDIIGIHGNIGPNGQLVKD